MKALPDIVRDSLADLADTAAVPDGIADRALAAGERRRRRRTVLVAAAAVVVAAAVATPYAVLRADSTAPPGLSGVRNAVFALHRGGIPTHDGDPMAVDRHWQVLDPATGEYREVEATHVSAPTADLRYAALLRRVPDPGPTRLGRYDTASGETRWYDGPKPAHAPPQISPDGRHAAYWSISEKGTDLVIVDLTSGWTTAIANAGPPPVASAPRTTPPSAPPDGLPAATYTSGSMTSGWRLDDDRVTVAGAVYDLAGRQIGTLPVPDGTHAVGVRPGDDGLVVQPDGQANVFALTDRRGAVIGQVTIPPACPEQVNCSRPKLQVLGWRGANELVVWPGMGPSRRSQTAIEAVDLRAGELRTVHALAGSPSVDGLVIMPADRLSREVRERIAF
jgi:hypothetical protein